MKTLTQTDSAVATAQIADACMRLKFPFRSAPAGIKPVVLVDRMICGSVIPVRHYGSVDVFFEALELASSQNGILVIDNGGREDEACIGDLTVLEVKDAGLEAMIVWGLHRDNSALREIGFPVFTYGSCSPGPSRLDVREPDALTSARFGNQVVTKFDTAFADQDGVIFVETAHVDQILTLATTILNTERKQAEAVTHGVNLRKQFQFQEYLQHRQTNPEYTFRMHLRALAKAIEE